MSILGAILIGLLSGAVASGIEGREKTADLESRLSCFEKERQAEKYGKPFDIDICLDPPKDPNQTFAGGGHRGEFK